MKIKIGFALFEVSKRVVADLCHEVRVKVSSPPVVFATRKGAKAKLAKMLRREIEEVGEFTFEVLPAIEYNGQVHVLYPENMNHDEDRLIMSTDMVQALSRS